MEGVEAKWLSVIQQIRIPNAQETGAEFIDAYMKLIPVMHGMNACAGMNGGKICERRGGARE